MQQLEQFLMIEKSKSMRLAAEKLFLSQPALSHNLKKLENELGCQLFERSHNQLNLNEYGEIVLRHSNRIVQEIEDAKREIYEEKMRQTPKIQIGCYSYAFQSFVLPQLANALKDNMLECRIQDHARMLEDLISGVSDVIFTDQISEDKRIKAIKLFNEQVMVSLPSTSEYASRQCIYLHDLTNLNIYLSTGATGYTDWFVQVLGAAGVEAPLSHGVPFGEYLYTKDNIDQSHLTSSFIMRFVPAAARRVVIPLADGLASRDVFMAYKIKEGSRLARLISHIENNKDNLFNSSSFLPYFLFPGETTNLTFATDKN